ncbi:General transcription factor II-I repeat domain-containing protein 2 [Blattella germanica]|nr:General transcription factor II-I repeat domain-containing protein 2 [Blattella germanica]PSN42447.1 General transcription factor II-I repeat domain-containing protein 2 [Blattella germanica]
MRYESIEKLEIWFSVFDTRFTVDFKDIQEAELQMELIKLTCDRKLREKFMNSSSTELIEFNRTLMGSQFPNLMQNTAKTIAMFVSTYL